MKEPLDADALFRRVGRRIGELRAERGLTQAELAERAEVSVRYLQSVEGGRENLTLATLAAFAAMLEVDPRALLEAPSTPPPGPGRPRRT